MVIADDHRPFAEGLASWLTELGMDVEDGGRCSAANWSEVAQKVLARSGDWDLVRGVLESYGVLVEPVTQADAEAAATLWRAGSGLSLADRLCRATGDRFDAVV